MGAPQGLPLVPWFDSAFPGGRDYRLKNTAFESLGDIQARLSDAAKAKVGPDP